MVGLALAQAPAPVAPPPGQEAELSAYAQLERAPDGGYRLLPALSRGAARLAYPDARAGDARWPFAWQDLQPAFDTRRFECRNPARPLHCLRPAQVELPRCDAVAAGEAEFVRQSLTPSGYGATPAERGQRGAWMARPDDPLSVAGAPLAAAVAEVPKAALSLFEGLGRSVSQLNQPDCLGWHTRWVEFDHWAFDAALRRALAQQGWGDAGQRREALAALQQLERGRRDAEQAASAALQQLELDASQRAAPWLPLLRRPDGTPLPPPQPPLPPPVAETPPPLALSLLDRPEASLAQGLQAETLRLQRHHQAWVEHVEAALRALSDAAQGATQQRLDAARSRAAVEAELPALEALGEAGTVLRAVAQARLQRLPARAPTRP